MKIYKVNQMYYTAESFLKYLENYEVIDTITNEKLDVKTESDLSIFDSKSVIIKYISESLYDLFGFSREGADISSVEIINVK